MECWILNCFKFYKLTRKSKIYVTRKYIIIRAELKGNKIIAFIYFIVFILFIVFIVFIAFILGPIGFIDFIGFMSQCRLGKSLYKFPGNEKRQELLTTQTLESD